MIHRGQVSVERAKKEDISSPDDATATTSTGTGTSQANGDGDGAASATSAKEEADKASVAEETAGEGDDSSGKPRRRTRRD